MKKILIIALELLLCLLLGSMIFVDLKEAQERSATLARSSRAMIPIYEQIDEINVQISRLQEPVTLQGDKPYIIHSFNVRTPEEFALAASLADKYQFPLVIALDVNLSPEALRPVLDLLSTRECEFFITCTSITTSGLALADNIRQEFAAQDSGCFLLRSGNDTTATINRLQQHGYSTITLYECGHPGWLDNGLYYLDYTYNAVDSITFSSDHAARIDSTLNSNSMLLLCYDLSAVASGQLSVETLEKGFAVYSNEYCTGMKDAILALKQQRTEVDAIIAENERKIRELQEMLDTLNLHLTDQ